MLSDARKAYFEWLRLEYGSVVVIFRMYSLMRGTLLIGSIAGISVITNIYRESIRTFRWTTLEASGVVTHSERAVPEPLAVVITSLIMVVIASWVIWIDHYFELHQKICENRGQEIEIEMLGRGGLVNRISRLHRRSSNMFLLGRGLLLLLTAVWIIVFAGITFGIFLK